jgi:hypothetical protein
VAGQQYLFEQHVDAVVREIAEDGLPAEGTEVLGELELSCFHAGLAESVSTAGYVWPQERVTGVTKGRRHMAQSKRAGSDYDVILGLYSTTLSDFHQQPITRLPTASMVIMLSRNSLPACLPSL